MIVILSVCAEPEVRRVFPEDYAEQVCALQQHQKRFTELCYVTVTTRPLTLQPVLLPVMENLIKYCQAIKPVIINTIAGGATWPSVW